MQFIDDAEFQINIDLDNGARISSLIWRDLQITVPYRGQPHSHGWYAMGPWAGRIRDGLIKDTSGKVFELPTNIDPPNALHGFGYTSSWQDIGLGRALLQLPAPYASKKGSATLEQRIEVLDDAIRWSIEYDANGCDLPAWVGLHPWFARDIGAGNDADLIFDAAQMLQRDKDGLPTGQLITPPKQPWDDAFTGVRGVPAVLYEDVLRIDIESDAPWWVVYTEDSEGICIEPQSAPPDAANLSAVNQELKLDLNSNDSNYVEALFVFNSL